MDQPRLLCLCPTYGRRPELLENSIACFEAQEYKNTALFIYDDLGNIRPQSGVGWVLESTTTRCSSMPDKYDKMVELCRRTHEFDAVVVFEDDDLYCPWHLSAIAAAFETGVQWCHPTYVWTTYKRPPFPEIEPSGGRFHASLAISRQLLESLGGWRGVQIPGHEKRADFDLRLIGTLTARGGPPGRYDVRHPQGPSYVFRWGDTGHMHGEAITKGPDDETWYDRFQPAYASPIERLAPHLDANAQQTLRDIYHRLEVEP